MSARGARKGRTAPEASGMIALDWRPFATAPKDRDILATHAARGRRGPGQIFRWSAGWMQCARGHWYRPFFTPTHWADVPREERPAPMFAEDA